MSFLSFQNTISLPGAYKSTPLDFEGTLSLTPSLTLDELIRLFVAQWALRFSLVCARRQYRNWSYVLRRLSDDQRGRSPLDYLLVYVSSDLLLWFSDAAPVTKHRNNLLRF